MENLNKNPKESITKEKQRHINLLERSFEIKNGDIPHTSDELDGFLLKNGIELESYLTSSNLIKIFSSMKPSIEQEEKSSRFVVVDSAKDFGFLESDFSKIGSADLYEEEYNLKLSLCEPDDVFRFINSIKDINSLAGKKYILNSIPIKVDFHPDVKLFDTEFTFRWSIDYTSNKPTLGYIPTKDKENNLSISRVYRISK